MFFLFKIGCHGNQSRVLPRFHRHCSSLGRDIIHAKYEHCGINISYSCKFHSCLALRGHFANQCPALSNVFPCKVRYLHLTWTSTIYAHCAWFKIVISAWINIAPYLLHSFGMTCPSLFARHPALDDNTLPSWGSVWMHHHNHPLHTQDSPESWIVSS